MRIHPRRRRLDQTCAFVPESPNELTPARAGDRDGKASRDLGCDSNREPVPTARCGFGWWKCSCLGILPSFIAKDGA